MIFLNVKDKLEKSNIRKILKEFNIKDKIIENSEFNEEDYIKNIKKAKYIITDSDLETIKDMHSLNKNIIVYKSRNNPFDDEIFFKKGVYTYNRRNELREIINFLEGKNKINRKVIKIFSVFLILVVAILSLLKLYSIRIEKIEAQKELERQEQLKIKKKKEEELRKKSENIVFLGDSITHRYNLEKYYKEKFVVNSGVEGNTAKNILEDIENRVYIYNPTKVFLLVGTNDIDKYYNIGVDGVYKNIINVIEKIEINKPKAKIYVESILPVNHDIINSPSKGKDYNDIINLNEKLEKYCNENNLTYINLYDELVDEDGHIPPKYTTDGLHLSEDAYNVISEEIKKYIEE